MRIDTLPKANKSIPRSISDESPTLYAERLGNWYILNSAASHRKRLGQYMTPSRIAQFMAALSDIKGNVFRILDPGAGAGILVCALSEFLSNQAKKPLVLQVTVYEIDPQLLELLLKTMSYLKKYLSQEDIDFSYKILSHDFIATNGNAIEHNPQLFPVEMDNNFDIIISNPPYFKLLKSDARVKNANAIVHGQPNIYSLFMATATMLLRPGGQLIFITPRSYASGPYFRRFRGFFFKRMKPEYIHIFNSRKNAFKKDGVLQENIILKARKYDLQSLDDMRNNNTVNISCSDDTDNLRNISLRKYRLDTILAPNSSEMVLHIPVNKEEEKSIKIIRSWNGCLHAYGMQISTGPVVPFRATSFLCQSSHNNSPLLWMHNIRPMVIEWPLQKNGKAQYIKCQQESSKLLVQNNNYVLLRRFSAKEDKKRLIAAPLLRKSLEAKFIGLENHLNYIYRLKGELSEYEAFGLAAILNGELYDRFFRITNGNTQVSATEIRALPLPPLDKIINIGKRLYNKSFNQENIDKIINSYCQ